LLIGWLLPKVSLPLSNETVHADWSGLYSPYTPNVAIVEDERYADLLQPWSVLEDKCCGRASAA
jgi:hypothetical protein